jgi:hypothetical protein
VFVGRTRPSSESSQTIDKMDKEYTVHTVNSNEYDAYSYDIQKAGKVAEAACLYGDIQTAEDYGYVSRG